MSETLIPKRVLAAFRRMDSIFRQHRQIASSNLPPESRATAKGMLRKQCKTDLAIYNNWMAKHPETQEFFNDLTLAPGGSSEGMFLKVILPNGEVRYRDIHPLTAEGRAL